MATRPPTISPESSGSAALAQSPPSIDLSNELLSSAVPLPHDASILYAVFSPTTSPALHAETIELARRHVFELRKSSLLDSLLCSIRVEKGTQQLYVFSIVSSEGIGDPSHPLSSLRFDHLISSQISSFRPAAIYDPASTYSLNVWPSMSQIFPLHANHHASPLLPVETFRIPYALFIKAVRERLIDDICSVQDHDRRFCRLKGGFLMFPQNQASDWGIGWEHHAQNRPLIYTSLHLMLSRNRILIQPLLRPTHYVPICTSRPLPSGTPITLLPYGTPAYYLTSYNGPIATLTAQFAQSLSGLGCGEWATQFSKPAGSSMLGANAGCHPASRDPRFLIAWIDVQNKQGEEKGLTVIWPISLAVSFLPSSVSQHALRQLPHVPDLPAQLQPSPPPPAAPVPVLGSLAIAFATSPISPLTHSPPPPLFPTALLPALTRRSYLPGTVPCAVPYSVSAGTLSSLQFDSDLPPRDNVQGIAGEIGEYIDAVVKERERERERLRRERESTGTSNDASPARALSAVNTPGSVGISSPMSTTLMGTMNSPPMVGPEIAISSISAQVPTSGPLSVGAEPPLQPFYPSPPQTNSVPSSSMDTISQPLSASSTLVQPFAPAIESSAPTIDPSANAVTFSTDSAPVASFDSFPGFENWSQDTAPWQSSDAILDMTLGDVGMSVSMNVDSLPYSVDPIAGGGGRAWGSNDMGRMDIDNTGLDDIFTDEDFSFWDSKPQQSSVTNATTAVPPPLNMNSGAGLMPSAGPATLGIPSQLFEVANPPTEIMPSHAPVWPSNPLAVGFLQQGSVLEAPPELVPSSPVKTLSPPSGPATPRHVALDPAVRLTPRSPLAGGGVFDAIPFASIHRIADGKYTAGKFALPSPPDEEDRTQPITGPSSPGKSGWWNRYNAATDPRVGVVRKLIGIKRRHTDASVGSSHWTRASQEWARDVMQTPPPEDGYCLSDDSESDDDDDNMLLDNDEDDPTSPVAGSRPFTPLPAYIPLGPTLLHTYFQHSHLLPLSTPLRPSRMVTSPPGQTPSAAPVSVPTPVSPAALLGVTPEKSKSFEAAAQILAKEVVESATWNDAWHAHAADSWPEHRSVTGVWQADVRRVAKALAGLPGLQGPLDLQSVFSSEEKQPVLEQLEPPYLSVAKSEGLIQVLPTALRFWDKLGLSPRAGKKNICAFVFFEELDDARVDAVDKWLHWISSTYTGHNLGDHERGSARGCIRDGLVPVKFDSFRRTLSNFVALLPPSNSNYVFYIAMPPSAITITSPVLRQVFSAVKRAQKTHTEEQILFQFLPAHMVYSLKLPFLDRGGAFAFVSSIYSRIMLPVDRAMSRQITASSQRIRDFFQEPSFALARPLHTKVHLVRQFPVLSLDVVDRHTLLHVGYRLSSCGKWIYACCVDQRGEAHDLAVWLLPSESPETFIIQQLWTFAVNFAKRASVEWRIIIAKLGSMDARELEAWTQHLDSTVPVGRELPMVHVSLMCIETDATWTFIAPQGTAKRSPPPESRSSKPSSGSFMTDASSVTYCFNHGAHIDLLPPSVASADFESAHSYIPDLPDGSSPPDEQHVRSLRSVTLVRVPYAADLTSIAMLHLHQLHSARSGRSSLTIPDPDTLLEVTRNYHELAALARARWLKANPILPFHLGALEVIDRALAGSFNTEA
ncbi:mediator complex subunit 13 C-terminal-domain-containing protein [Gloeopeniophorella convolvens]|nr:mediator complex subunit 13 C-terminal-domain-containing protein [Gloeopeniophorella convolvens]